MGVYEREVAPDCLLALLGCSEDTVELPYHEQEALMFGMAEAKRIILKEWKSTSPGVHIIIRVWSSKEHLRLLLGPHFLSGPSHSFDNFSNTKIFNTKRS